MKILCLSSVKPEATPEKINPCLKEEAAHAWSDYKAGLVREWYFRTDRPGVVLMLECADVAEARRRLGDLPLVKAGLIDFEYIPLGPFLPLEALFAGVPAPER
jgi:hypothetical protein